MKDETGKLLIQWLKDSAAAQGLSTDFEGLGNHLGVSGKTLSALQKPGLRDFTVTLRKLRTEVAQWPNSKIGIFLIEELLRQFAEPFLKLPWPVEKQSSPKHLSPVTIALRLQNSEPTQEFLIEAAQSVDALNFDGHLVPAFNLAEQIWHAFYDPSKVVPPPLIPAGMVYARLLSNLGRYLESAVVNQRCLESAITDGNLMVEAFTRLDLLSLTHKASVIGSLGAMNEDVIKQYVSISDELMSRITKREAQHREVIWPANYCHRGMLIIASRSVNPNALTGHRKDFIKRYSEELRASSQFVSHEESYANANDLASCYALCAVGQPREAMAIADSLLSKGQLLSDISGILRAKVVALRRSGTESDIEEALAILDQCEDLCRGNLHTPHASLVRQERIAIKNSHTSTRIYTFGS